MAQDDLMAQYAASFQQPPGQAVSWWQSLFGGVPGAPAKPGMPGMGGQNPYAGVMSASQKMMQDPNAGQPEAPPPPINQPQAYGKGTPQQVPVAYPVFGGMPMASRVMQPPMPPTPRRR
jgi:hypothetical protein